MMSKQAFMASLILTGGVISTKMLSLLYMGIKNEAPKTATAFRASFLWIFGCNDVFALFSTYENIFSTGENCKGIQLERITLDCSKH